MKVASHVGLDALQYRRCNGWQGGESERSGSGDETAQQNLLIPRHLKTVVCHAV